LDANEILHLCLLSKYCVNYVVVFNDIHTAAATNQCKMFVKLTICRSVQFIYTVGSGTVLI